ncbi:MAG TPA: HAMP domain-containing sensor histidine kinase [Actinomycetota bacterium]|nr:HAMP domain-containing sensor histidine kinase [Actinomycetota bacterium]
MGRLERCDIDRRRRHLLAAAFILLGAFASFGVLVSFLGAEIWDPLRGAPPAARLGVLVLTAAFVGLAFERDRTLARAAALNERERVLNAALKSRLEVLESLLAAGDRLNAPLSVSDVVDVLLDAAIELVGAEGGAVSTFDQEGEEIIVSRRHSVDADVAQLALADTVDLALEVEGRNVGTLSLCLPFESDDPLIQDILSRFTQRAAVAVDRAQRSARDRASVAYLRAANVVKSRFLQTVSHELRTPLTSIIGYSRTLEHHWDRLPDTMKLEFIAAVNEQGARLKILVERILEAARVEMEGVTVHRVVHDVRRSVHRALEQFEHDVERLVVALPDAEVEAEVDPIVVEHAVQNLVDNALRYTTGEVRVSLDCYRSSIVIQVSDTGPGMEKMDLDMVVEPLVRIDENVHSGTGLGLHIVRTLVADHEGKLDISSGSAGTRVTVTLPRGSASDAARLRSA